ncbi:MAG: hypothetical protein WBA93_13710 [Microcoleaceae cyanobacterium]
MNTTKSSNFLGVFNPFIHPPLVQNSILNSDLQTYEFFLDNNGNLLNKSSDISAEHNFIAPVFWEKERSLYLSKLLTIWVGRSRLKKIIKKK